MKLSDISEEEIKEACRAWRRTNPYGPTPEVALAHKYPAKLILKKMEKMIAKKILECGVSVRTAWVVEDGDLD